MAYKSAFTPLRVSLMVFILVANLAAVLALLFPEASWSRVLGIFATVFILLAVFAQFLELVWLYSFKKQQNNEQTVKSYNRAIAVYFLLLPLGFLMVYLYLA